MPLPSTLSPLPCTLYTLCCRVYFEYAVAYLCVSYRVNIWVLPSCAVVYVCMHVYFVVHVCFTLSRTHYAVTCIWVCLCIYLCMLSRICVYAIFICMCAAELLSCMYVCVYVCMHVCVYAYMCACMYACMCECMYACCAFVERAVKQMVVYTGKSSIAVFESIFWYVSLGMFAMFRWVYMLRSVCFSKMQATWARCNHFLLCHMWTQFCHFWKLTRQGAKTVQQN
jgi:hypothetical protein